MDFDPDDEYFPSTQITKIATTRVVTTTTTFRTKEANNLTVTVKTVEVSINSTHASINVYRSDIAIGLLAGFLSFAGNKLSYLVKFRCIEPVHSISKPTLRINFKFLD